jgi:hypothetical protein
VATLTPNPTFVAGIHGLWKGDNGSFYLFGADGMWSWDEQQARVQTAPENRGKWWLEGDELRIVDLSGKDPCPAGQIGQYQLHFEGDALVLGLVKDPCGVRIRQTAGKYHNFAPAS